MRRHCDGKLRVPYLAKNSDPLVITGTLMSFTLPTGESRRHNSFQVYDFQSFAIYFHPNLPASPEGKTLPRDHT